MKKIIGSLFLCCAVFISSYAQTSVWKVTDAKGNKIYLGGTVHVLSPKEYPLPKEFYTAYQKSEILAIEADIEKMENPAMAQGLMSKMMYQNGKSLSTILDKNTYLLLKEKCQEYNIPLAQLDKFKPSLVIITLTAMQMRASGINAEGVDKHFLFKAKTDKKEVLFLESIESQVNLLSNMGAGNENNFVKKSIKDLEDTDTIMNDLLSDWRNGEAKTMGKQITEMKNEYPKLYNALLVKRNNNWMPIIDAYFKTKKVEFVLMGALHLHGESGILHQLRQKGYQVTKL